MAASVAIPIIVTGTAVLTMWVSAVALNESIGLTQVRGTLLVGLGVLMIFADSLFA